MNACDAPRQPSRIRTRARLIAVPIVMVWVAVLLAAPAEAQDAADLITGQVGELTPAIVQLLIVITALALLPSMLVMVTSFTKFVIVLSVLRNALGLQQSPPNLVIAGLALFLTLFVMQPTLERAWEGGIAPYLAKSAEPQDALWRTVEPFREFMMSNTREKDLVLFEELAANRDSASSHSADTATGTDSDAGPAPRDAASGNAAAPPAGQEPGVTATATRPPLTTLIPAFMTSELRKAFTIAFLLFIPFLVIEMIVSSVLMAMGMMMVPPVVISLPFKLIFFVLVDGWWLLTGSLVRSYG